MTWPNKKFFLAGVIIVAMAAFGLEGCASPAQRKTQAVEALQRKYQEKFEAVSFTQARLFEDYYTVTAYAVEYPHLVFRATVDLESGDIMDSYVTKRVCDRLSDKISQNLGALETDYYVFTEAMFGDTLVTDPTISLEKYLEEDPYNKFTIYLCLNQEHADAKNIANTMVNMMDGISGISGSVVICLADSDLMEKIQEYVTSHDDTYNEFDEMVEKGYIGYVNMENGKFNLTEEKLKNMAGDLL